METQQSGGGEDGRWQELLAHYDLVQAAANLALRALLDAYKPNPDGLIMPTDELMTRYRNASSLRLAAEQALLAFAQARGRQSPE